MVARGCPSCEDSRAKMAGENYGAMQKLKQVKKTPVNHLATYLETVPLRFKKTELSGWRDLTPAHADFLRLFDGNLMSYIEDRPSYQNFLLLGPPGIGKTHLMVSAGRILSEAGMTVRYTNTMSMFADIKSSYSGGGDEEEKIAKYTTPDFLLLDEVGVTKNTEWEQGILLRVISERYDNMRSMGMASNLGLEAFSSFLGERAFSRLSDSTSGIFFCQEASLQDYRSHGRSMGMLKSC